MIHPHSPTPLSARSLLLALCAVLSLPASAPAMSAGQPAQSQQIQDADTMAFPQAVITAALAADAPYWSYTYTKRSHRLNETFALYTLCLDAYLKQENAELIDPLQVDNIVDKFRSVMSGGKEPECQGGLGGWSHGAFAWSLAFAKHTDALWSSFTTADKAKADLLMEALAVTSAFCFASQNDYKCMIDGDRNFGRNWNPNHVEGYVGVGMAAAWYFGASELNNRLSTFDFDPFIVQLQTAGFTNIVAAWTRIPGTKKALMQGGAFEGDNPLLDYGTGGGVRGYGFEYRGVPISDAWAVYKKLSERMYSHVAITEIPITGKPGQFTHIIGKDAENNYLISPFEGMFGMCHEFKTTNATKNGSPFRSLLSYVYEGWMNNMANAAAVRARGLWDPQGSNDNALVRAVGVGTGDFLYKTEHGYHGFANGKADNQTEQTLINRGGWSYTNDWWVYLIEPAVIEAQEASW